MRISNRVACAVAVTAVVCGVHLRAQESGGRIHGCVARDGSLRVVATPGACRPQERPLDWNVMGPEGLQGPAGPEGQQGLPGAGGEGGLRVYNALDGEVGPLLDASHVVLTLPDGRKSAAEVFVNGPPAGWVIAMTYESPDCSGQPLVSWSSYEELLPPTLVRTWGAWAIRPGTTRNRALRSYRFVTDAGPSASCQTFQSTTFASEFDSYTLEELGLIAPLSVR